MKPKKYGANSDAKGWQDLCRVTGLGEATVKAGILSGELPGYKVGKSYVVTAEAFQAFVEGRWLPIPHRIFAEPIQAKPELLRKLKSISA